MKTAITQINKNLLVKSQTIVFSSAPKVFLIATSFSFCSINKDDNANNPNNAMTKTTIFKVVKSVCCFWNFSNVLANCLSTKL